MSGLPVPPVVALAMVAIAALIVVPSGTGALTTLVAPNAAPPRASPTTCAPPSISLDPPAVSDNDVELGGTASAGSGCTLSGIQINWGDLSSTAQSVFPFSHTYARTGSYSISGVATQSDGQTATATVTAVINTMRMSVQGTANLTLASVGESISFQGTVDGGQAPVSYYWNFGGRGTSDLLSTTYRFSTAGLYAVWFQANDSSNPNQHLRWWTNVTVVAWGTLSVAGSARPSSVPVGATSNLTVSVSGGTGPYSYLWSGEPLYCSVGNQSNENCTLTEAGHWNVTIEVLDSDYHVGLVTLELDAYSALLTVRASSNVTSGPYPLAVAFSAVAWGGVPDYFFAWSFGDGGVSSLQDPSHEFDVAGTYEVQVTVTDGSGTTAVASLNISVEPSLLGVTVTPGGPIDLTFGGSITFAAKPSCYGGPCPPGVTYVWSLTNSRGQLNTSSGSSVLVTAGTLPGDVALLVNATLHGITMQSTSVSLVVGPETGPLPSPCACNGTSAGELLGIPLEDWTLVVLASVGVGTVVAIALVRTRRGRQGMPPPSAPR